MEDEFYLEADAFNDFLNQEEITGLSNLLYYYRQDRDKKEKNRFEEAFSTEISTDLKLDLMGELGKEEFYRLGEYFNEDHRFLLNLLSKLSRTIYHVDAEETKKNLALLKRLEYTQDYSLSDIIVAPYSFEFSNKQHMTNTFQKFHFELSSKLMTRIENIYKRTSDKGLSFMGLMKRMKPKEKHLTFKLLMKIYEQEDRERLNNMIVAYYAISGNVVSNQIYDEISIGQIAVRDEWIEDKPKDDLDYLDDI